MNKSTAWWVYLWIPILLSLVLYPILPLAWYGGVAVFQTVRFLAWDFREVRAGRRSGLWRFCLVAGLAALVGIASLSDKDNPWALSLAVTALVSAPLFWWVIGPVVRIVIRRSSDRMEYLREEARRRQERETDAREAPLRRQADEQRVSAQKRRQDARASALLSFSFYAAKLGDRFPRAMFDQYVEQYMGDAHPPDLVEQRGRELIAIFEKHLADVQPPRRQTSIASLTRWYEEMKAQILALPLEEEVKEVRLADLERRFDELLEKHLESTGP